MSKFKAKQHIPGFAEGPRGKSAEFDTVEELLSEEWVQRYLKWDEAEIFVRSKDHDLLMVANKEHTWWWVVAYVPKGSIDSLPVCECKK